MDVHVIPFPWLVSILIILLTILITKCYKKQAQRQNLPPGPPKLPLIGNLHQLAAKNGIPHRSLAALSREYGPIMQLQLGEVSAMVVSSADVAREVMRTHDTAFCSRPEVMLGKELLYGSTDIALAPYGEYWRQVRKIATLELFTVKRVKSFGEIREEEVKILVESIASEAGSVVNLSKKLFALAFDITTRIAFSKKGNEQEAFRRFLAISNKAFSSFSVTDLYPSLDWLHSISGMKRKLHALVEESNRILDPIIEEHKSRNKPVGEEEDLVDVLLKFQKDNANANEFSLTTNNIKAITLELFGAGSETSSSVIEWAMSEMLRNPRIMAKAQAEVRQVYQGIVDERKLDELKYLKLVIKETLRLHPPLPLLAPRECIKSCQIYNYEIPLKTRVIINAWAIGRDEEYWSQPNEFVPERFLDSLIDYKGNHFEFIPFGAGRRGCPGIALGMAHLLLPLATLLYHFDWKLPSIIKEPQDLCMDECFGISARRKDELLVIPISYQS